MSKNNNKYIKQYTSALERQSYWRLFIDGGRQKSDFKTPNTLGEFKEYQLGHLLWALREPNGLRLLKETAKKLYSAENINQELTFEFLATVQRLSYPFEDHLRLAKAYVTDNTPRMFGYVKLEKEITWVQERSLAIQKLVKSQNAPWGFQKSSQGDDAFEITTIWTPAEKIKYYPIILNQYNKSISAAKTDEAKIKLIIQHMQDIEDLHFFADGNCRMVYLLLNKELLKHGFQPVILLNPNYFDQMTLDDLYDQVIQGQAAFNKFIIEDKPYDECLKNKEIQKNLQAINSKDFKIFGYNEITFTKCLEFTKEAAIIFKDVLKSIVPERVKSFEGFQEGWNEVLKALLVYEAIKAFKPTEKISCEGFFTSPNHKENLGLLREKGDSPEMNDITNYLELLNYEHIKDYISSQNSSGSGKSKFDFTKVTQNIQKYLQELSALSAKYLNDYSLKSLADPLTCHMTIAEFDGHQGSSSGTNNNNNNVTDDHQDLVVEPIGKNGDSGDAEGVL